MKTKWFYCKMPVRAYQITEENIGKIIEQYSGNDPSDFHIGDWTVIRKHGNQLYSPEEFHKQFIATPSWQKEDQK